MWKSLIPDTMVVGFKEVSSVDDTGAVVMASRFEYTQPDDADVAFASPSTTLVHHRYPHPKRTVEPTVSKEWIGWL